MSPPWDPFARGPCDHDDFETSELKSNVPGWEGLVHRCTLCHGGYIIEARHLSTTRRRAYLRILPAANASVPSDDIVELSIVSFNNLTTALEQEGFDVDSRPPAFPPYASERFKRLVANVIRQPRLCSACTTAALIMIVSSMNALFVTARR
jgi:hypothetical protein